MADETTDRRAENTCKNPPCSCTVSKDDGDYCSAHCQGTTHHTQIDCDCGHPACSGDI